MITRSIQQPPSPLLVDDREKKNFRGQELYTELKHLRLPVQRAHLESGDVSFVGNGPRGEARIGIERKTIHDLLGSITSGRLSGHQVPRMARGYDYRWILVEGLWRCHPTKDVIQVWKGPKSKWCPMVSRLTYSQVSGYLIGIQIGGGFRAWRTNSIQESAMWIGDVYRVLTKPWKEHRSHLLIEKETVPDRILWTRPSFARRMTAGIPGIGWEKSKAVVKRFQNFRAVANAVPEDLMEVPGIGKKLAERIPRLMTGEERE